MFSEYFLRFSEDDTEYSADQSLMLFNIYGATLFFSSKTSIYSNEDTLTQMTI